MDIAVWLRSLSLEQYEAAFRENAIDADVLHDLTDQDLEKLGVLLGHRRRLLRAIAALDGTVATSSALAPLQVKPSPAAEVAGDRRHVTVMFCDLVDSTGIAAKLDAEEWRPAWHLRRRCFGGSDGTGRKDHQEAGRRAYGAVRLSGRARERRRSAARPPLRSIARWPN